MDYYSSIAAFWIVYLLVMLGVAVGLAFIPASVARKKGYSYGGFWCFGFFAFVPAIIVAACIKPKQKPLVYQNIQRNYQDYK